MATLKSAAKAIVETFADDAPVGLKRFEVSDFIGYQDLVAELETLSAGLIHNLDVDIEPQSLTGSTMITVRVRGRITETKYELLDLYHAIDEFAGKLKERARSQHEAGFTGWKTCNVEYLIKRLHSNTWDLQLVDIGVLAAILSKRFEDE